MKTTAVYSRKYAVRYPNAATRRQIWNRIVDSMMLAASGMAMAVILMFLLALA